MALTPWLCENCGFWRQLPARPPDCPICTDHRHAPPTDAWSFLTEDQVAERARTNWTEVEPGIHRLDSSERFHIGPSGYLIEHEAGNVLFEAPNWLSDGALDFIDSRGGLAFATASHPHVYGALYRAIERFAPRVPLAVADLPWAVSFGVSDPYDDTFDLGGNRTLHRTGGHFAGHQVLHDAGRRILFCGDALKLDLDPEDERKAVGISTHKAFVRQVPLTPDELRQYRAVFEPLDYDQTWTPFEQGANAGRSAALHLIDELLAHGSHPRPVPVR